MNHVDGLRAHLRAYYGEHLTSSADLATTACCAAGPPPAHLQPLLARIDTAVTDRFYGCGFPIPPALAGATTLDLGCGTGRDVYLLSQLVGASGHVHGVDMTPAQLQVARDTLDAHMARFGFATPNVHLHEGFIEDLSFLDDASVDVAVSNCVLNLSPLKERVLAEVARVLRPGGELYLSDVVADRRLPDAVVNHPLLRAECLGGAPYLHDLLDMARRAGFAGPRVVARAPIEINDPALRVQAGAARFESVTLRLLLLPDLEPRCEDYGQVATYLGGVPGAEAVLWLDDHHAFEVGRPERVCGNTADMLTCTRFAPFFRVTERGWHMGEFPCGPTMASGVHAKAASTGACC